MRCISTRTLTSLFLALASTIPGYGNVVETESGEPVRYLGPVDATEKVGGRRSDVTFVGLVPAFRIETVRGSLVVMAGDGHARHGVTRTLSAFGASASSPAFAFAPD